MSTPEERWTKIDELIAKNAAAIRDLIAVSRTLIDTQQKTGEQLAELDAEVKELARILKAFLESREKPNGNR